MFFPTSGHTPTPIEQRVSAAYEKATDILYQAEETLEHLPKLIVFLVSGGNDSTVMSYVCDDIFRCMFSRGYWGGVPAPTVMHINTKIGIKANRQFVHDYADLYFGKDRFREYVTPESYAAWCMRNGFPGESAHRWMYIRLKERCIKQLVQDHTYHINKHVLHDILNELPHFHPRVQYFLLDQVRHEMQKAFRSRSEKIMFVTGARKQESQRRAFTVKPIDERGREIWLSPLSDWSIQEVLDVKEHRHLPRNEVADVLGRVKDCLCGAFAKRGELQMICTFYPEEGKYLLDLQEKVMAAGFPWGWKCVCSFHECSSLLNILLLIWLICEDVLLLSRFE